MITSELTFSERMSLENFPLNIHGDDLITYFTLSKADLDQIPLTSQDYNRLGFAVQLCALRFLGFFPKDISNISPVILHFLSNQLGISVTRFNRYGNRKNTKFPHQKKIIRYLKFKKLNSSSSKKIYQWLQDRVMEHENTIFLIRLTCEKLLRERIVRPGITTIEAMVSRARNESWERTYLIVHPILKLNRPFINDLLDSEDDDNCYSWLKSSPIANSSNTIIESLEKLEFLTSKGVHKWDLSELNPNRLKHLFECGKKSNRFQLRTMTAKKKYSITIALLKMTLEKIIDEIIEQFDRNLSEKHSRARRKLEDFIKDASKSTNEKMWLLKDVGKIVLDRKIKGTDIRKSIYKNITEDDFKKAIDDIDRVIRPKDDYFLDFFADSFSDIRKYSLRLLSALHFKSNNPNNSILKNVNFIKKYNKQKDQEFLEDVQADSIPKRWQEYVFPSEGKFNYRYYEMCTLWELRLAIKSGDIWVENSRKFSNPESYLIPKKQWPSLKEDFLKMVGISNDFSDQLKKKRKELEALIPIVDDMLAKNNKIGEVRIENDELIVPRYLAEDKEENKEIEQSISNLLPKVDLVDILVEVDSWVDFSKHFTHLSGNESRNDQITINLYASIISLACNIGHAQMSQASSIPRQSLIWATEWYLREETIRSARTEIINYHHKHPLSSYWGTGAFSSSDGKRLLTTIKSRIATKNPKYCGYNASIITNLTWTSDQCSQYGTKIIPSTKRDATFDLDEILNNITDLEISEHTTDTAGYTDIIFALFDLCGLKFCPRLKDIGSQKLYQFDKISEKYKHVAPLLRGKIRENYIRKYSSEMLRVVGSIKLGWVTSSLLVSKIQSSKGINNSANPLREYGRIEKTIHILKYISDEKYQRKIGKQLNKGEALHTLERFIFFCNESKVRVADLEDQQLQVNCLNLMTNAVVLWNTVYMWLAIAHLKSNGHIIIDDDISNLSPCRIEHVNRLGKLSFHLKKRFKMRPLRDLK